MAQGNIYKDIHRRILLSFFIIFMVGSSALELPYEVRQSILAESELDDLKDLVRVNVSDSRSPTRPIYRLDLDPNYVAYYEIDAGRDYVILSASSRTRDFRMVEHGPDPRPTDVLMHQAHKNGQMCGKFFRVTPWGLMICSNQNGTIVAASYNWVDDIAEIDDWRKLDNMVKRSFGGFMEQWKKRAVNRRSKLDWVTTEKTLVGGRTKEEETYEEPITPGSTANVALDEHSLGSVRVFVRNYGKKKGMWQKRLCKVLVDICRQEENTNVNLSAIAKTANHLPYLRLEVRGNRKYVGNTLQWKELGFFIEFKSQKRERIRKHFVIDLRRKRSQRSTTGSNQGSISRESEFPDYNQHRCCGGCYSGCTPVAWAQVFGYFDRISRYSSMFSPNLFGGTNTVAPLTLTDAAKTFVEGFRPYLRTRCTGNEGSTSRRDIRRIEPWFRKRQGSKARVSSYLEKKYFWQITKRYQSSSWMERKGVWFLQFGYPVVFSFNVNGKKNSGHSAVATMYRKKSKNYYHCDKKRTGWWTGRRTKTVCGWKTYHYTEFFIHYGWGGSSNKWQSVSPKAVHVAYISK